MQDSDSIAIDGGSLHPDEIQRNVIDFLKSKVAFFCGEVQFFCLESEESFPLCYYVVDPTTGSQTNHVWLICLPTRFQTKNEKERQLLCEGSI